MIKDLNDSANKIIALVNGNLGPFFENKSSFFGQKNVNSTMKDCKMQTDIGGAIITKSDLTYGQADEITASINIQEIWKFIDSFEGQNCYWKCTKTKMFIGELYWVIYEFLRIKKIIFDKYDGQKGPYYNNSNEYLYDEIIKRMISEKLIIKIEKGFYKLNEV